MAKEYQKIKLLSIVLILILALGLRFYKLNENPAGFFCDEAANGFNAYKILTTGKDEYGITLPFFFRSFGDYRNPVTIYSMIPAIAVFGINEFSVRLTMVIYGTLTVLLVFLFTKELFWKSQPFIGTFAPFGAALFLAISPWHIQFSRTGFEFASLPFFLTLGLWGLFYCFHTLESQETKRASTRTKLMLCFSLFILGITFYTYYPIQIVLVPFLAGIIFIYRKSLFSKTIRNFTGLALLVFLVSLTPFLLGIKNGEALTRFRNVSPLTSGKDFKEVAPSLVKTYLDHFSPAFLFTKGDLGMPGHFITRHSVKNTGELYLFQLPLLIIGLVALIVTDFRVFSLLLIWFLLFPVGSAVVGEGPFAHRSIFGVIPFQILSAYGLAFIFSKISHVCFKTILLIIFVASLLFPIKNYLHEYFGSYPLYSADFWGWQYGPRDTMKYFLANKDVYDDLYLSGEFNAPEIFLKFYDPKNLCQNKCKIGDFWRNPPILKPQRRQLFSLSPEYLANSGLKSKFLVKNTLYYPNGKIAFVIGKMIK